MMLTDGAQGNVLLRVIVIFVLGDNKLQLSQLGTHYTERLAYRIGCSMRRWRPYYEDSRCYPNRCAGTRPSFAQYPCTARCPGKWRHDPGRTPPTNTPGGTCMVGLNKLVVSRLFKGKKLIFLKSRKHV